MNCSVGTCTGTAQVREPLPLCGTCALRVLAAYAAANLGSEPVVQVRQTDAQTEIGTLFRILDEEGWNRLDLNRAIEVLNRPKATAARRLAEARRQYAADLNRRAGQSRREAEIDTVFARIKELGSPKAVTLDDVMDELGLKQTTAFDRLDAARKRWTSENA